MFSYPVINLDKSFKHSNGWNIKSSYRIICTGISKAVCSIQNLLKRVQTGASCETNYSHNSYAYSSFLSPIDYE